jgi:DNA-binding transcriptional LysR family regulator
MNGTTLASTRMRYFEQVAQDHSVRRAAETLNVSASAVNRQILMLENELGVALFERLPRGMRATEAGNIILSVIRRFDQDYAAAISQIDALRNLRRGHVSIGTLLYLSEGFVPEMIAKMRKEYPNISYSAFFGTSSEIVSRVIDGRLDVGLCWAPAPSSPITRHKLHRVPLGVAALPGHPIVKKKKLRLRDLVDYPVIFPDKGTDYRNILDQINLGTGRIISPAVETTSMSMMRRLVLSGVGVALVSRPAVINDVSSGRMVLRKLDDPGIGALSLSLFTRAERALPVAVQMILQHLSTGFDALVQEAPERPARSSSARSKKTDL